MSPDISQRSGTAPRWALAWIVAAVALVLNWTVPTALVSAQFEAGNTAPGLSSGARAAQPGTLPRAQPRSITAEAGVPKPLLGKLNADGKPKVVLPIIAVDAIARAPVAWRIVCRAAPPPLATRFFDPRAPPAAA
jgi:hypothetical protein